ncbi:DUF309 domain-containing protein [Fredinandcohnia humi]
MYPKAYIDYLIYFHCDRDYFECHEILEEHWKMDSVDKRKTYWVALIQIAVSLYHHRRGNFAGALRMMKSAISIINEEKNAIQQLGLQVEELVDQLQQKLEDIQNGLPYKSINLPINDSKLLSTCVSISERAGKSWGKPSDITNKQLIDKHRLRDRSDVIEEREKQIRRKQKERQGR